MVDTNIPDEELRWSLVAAGREFGLTPGSLRKRLVAVGENADREDHCYSTEQIINAVFGSIQAPPEVRERR